MSEHLPAGRIPSCPGEHRAEFMHQIEALDEYNRATAQGLDKALLTINGGALALSLTYMHEIAPHPTATGLLAAAWILVISSMGLTLIAYLLGLAAVQVEAEILKERYGYADGPECPRRGRRGLYHRLAGRLTLLTRLRWGGSNVANRLVHGLNWLSVMATIAGLATLAGFSYGNLPKGDNRVSIRRTNEKPAVLIQRPKPSSEPKPQEPKKDR